MLQTQAISMAYERRLAEGVSSLSPFANVRRIPWRGRKTKAKARISSVESRGCSLLSPHRYREICGEEVGRASKKLSAIQVKAVTKTGRHGDGDGLYLNVAAGGSKSWVFLWMKEGRRREMGLGAFPAVGLADARVKAENCRRIIAAGGDPLATRTQDKPKTFGEAADAFVASMEGGWRNDKHAAQWRMTLGDAYCKSIRTVPVGDIGTEDVLKILTPIWLKKAETASRLRGRIERVLDFAKIKGWRSGENPALWRGHLKNALPPRQKLQRGHHAAMPYSQVPAFVARLQGTEAMAARALEFLILTAARSGEVLGATWAEFDLDDALWTIPATRMKAGRVHRVPLCDRALAIVTQLSELRVNEYVFAGEKKDRPLSSMSLSMLMRRLKVEAATPHGFRSSFRDYAGDETTFPREVAEAALAHEIGNVTETAYRRSDALSKRRKLMENWEAFCLAKHPDNLLTFRQA